MNDLKESENYEIEFVTASMSDPDVQAKVKAAGIRSHGIIATSAEGKIVTTVEGHSYGKEQILEVAAKLLAKE